MKKRRKSRRIFKIFIFIAVSMIIITALLPKAAVSEAVKTGKSSKAVTDVKITYDDNYRTKDYTCWSGGYSSWTGTVYNNLNTVKNGGVVRRGTTFTFTGTGATPSTVIEVRGPTDSGSRPVITGWNPTYVGGENWQLTIPKDVPVGDYQIYMDSEYCTLYVIFDVFLTKTPSGMTDNQFAGWAYDEASTADNYIPVLDNTGIATLNPFTERATEMAVSVLGGNTTTPYEAGIKMYRVTNSRITWAGGVTLPSLTEMLDQATALPVWEAKNVSLQTGYTLPSGMVLATGYQCTHFAYVTAGLARSLGIPSRGIHCKTIWEWNYHEWAELYIDNPGTTLAGSDSHWLVFDSCDQNHNNGHDSAGESSIDTEKGYYYHSIKLSGTPSTGSDGPQSRGWKGAGVGGATTDWADINLDTAYTCADEDIPTISLNETAEGDLGEGDRDFFRIDVSSVSTVDVVLAEGKEYAWLYVRKDAPVTASAIPGVKSNYVADAKDTDAIIGLNVDGTTYLYVMVDNCKGDVEFQDNYNVGGTSETHHWVVGIGPGPYVKVNNPNGNETLVAGSAYIIEWEAVDVYDTSNSGALNINITYSMNSGLSYDYTIATNEVNDGIYIWNVPNIESTNVRIKVTADDGTKTNNDTSDDDFTIKPPDPLNEIVSGTGAFSGDWFGYSVSNLGDVNGDGYNDSIVGAPYNDFNSQDAGASYIFFGRTTWSTGNLDVANADVKIYGTNINDHFGWSVNRAGNVNGDLYDDVIIGAPGNTSAVSGSAYIFYGREAWNPSYYNANNADVIINGGSNDDRFGFSVSGAGDVNNADNDDIIIGAPYNDSADGRWMDCGAAYIFYGDSGLIGTISVTSADVNLTGATIFDYFGFSVSGAGDVNGDSYDDVIIGAPGADKAYICYGSATMENDFGVLGIKTYGYTGVTTAGPHDAYACDVDVFPFAGDAANRNTMVEAPTDAQYTAISASDNSRWTTADPGALDEIFMWFEINGITQNPADITQIDFLFEGYLAVASDVKIYVMKAGADWTQDASWVQVGTTVNFPAGTDSTMTVSLTSGFSTYIDGTGKLVWGVYQVVSSESLNVDYAKVDIKTECKANITLTGESTTGFGFSVSDLRDVNNDGYDDIIVGAPKYNNDQGRAYIFYGNTVMTTDPYVSETVLFEDFDEGGAVPSGWDVSDWTGPAVAAQWHTTNDNARYSAIVSGTDYGMVSDSDQAGSGAMDAWLKSPAMDCSVYDKVQLQFAHVFNWISGYGVDTIYVYVATDGSVDSADYLAYSFTGADIALETKIFDISGYAAHQPNVKIGFRYTANYDMWWIIDDVIITGKKSSSTTFITGEMSGDKFGYSVAWAGDINNDGINDTVIGAPYNDRTASATGAIYVFYGNISISRSMCAGAADKINYGESANDNFGFSVSGVGDVNNDNYDDVIAGAPGYSSNTGKAYVYTTQPMGEVDNPPISNANVPAPYWKTSVPFNVGWSASDDNGLTSVGLFYRYSNNNSTWGDWTIFEWDESVSGLSASGTFIFTAPSGDGYYEFYTVANDTKPQSETKTSADSTAGVDTAPPTSYAVDILPYWKTATPFTITASATDENITGGESGIKEVALYYNYSADNSTDWTGWVLFGINATVAPYEWLFDAPEGDGYYRFYSLATDNATNQETDIPLEYDQIAGVDREKPEILDVLDSPDPQQINGYVNITATITDNVEMGEVYLNITGPNGQENISITQNLTGSTYYCNKTYSDKGIYSYFVWVRDKAGNQNSSDMYYFEIDTTKPEISSVQASPDLETSGGYINISAMVTDNYQVDMVWLNITYPDDTYENISITLNKTGSTYYCNRTYTMLGWYNYTIWANDTSNNWNNSNVYSFNITGALDTEPPQISIPPTASPDPQEVNNWVNITVYVSDNVEVSSVKVNISYPNGTLLGNFSMTGISLDANGNGTYYYNTTYSEVGDYSYFIWTKDSSNNENATISYTFTMQDTTEPEISSVQANPEEQSTGGFVNISAVVTDNHEVNEVYLNITYPDNSYENISITQNKTGSTYYCNKTYTMLGWYNYTIWANDSSNNWNNSDVYSFNITVAPDTEKPQISNVDDSPDPWEVGGYVNVSATVTDNVGVSEVFLNITYPDSSYVNISITQNKTGDTYYCNKTYSILGEHSYFIWANDTSSNGNKSSTFTFNIVTIDYIIIEDAPGGTGNPIGEMPSYLVSDTDMYYAVGYNYTFGYIKEVICLWDSNNTPVGTVSPAVGISTTFTAENAGECYIRAENVSLGLSDITETITVNPVKALKTENCEKNNKIPDDKDKNSSAPSLSLLLMFFVLPFGAVLSANTKGKFSKKMFTFIILVTLVFSAVSNLAASETAWVTDDPLTEENTGGAKSPDTVTLYPNGAEGAGTANTFETWVGGNPDAWQTNDGDTTYGQGDANNVVQTAHLDDPSLTGDINSVTVYAVLRSVAAIEDDLGILIYALDGVGVPTAVEGLPEFASTLSYATYSYTWTTNPASGASWTWADINALEAGIDTDVLTDVRVTQVYAVVDYTPSAVDNPPVVGAYEPGGTSGQTYNIGDIITVKWNVTDDNPMSADNINISYGNVSVGWTSIVTNTANDETHDWDTSTATPGIYYINISAYDSIGQESYDLGNFTFELVGVVDNPPVVNAYEPGGTSGQTYTIGDIVTVKWNVTDDNPMPADNINISYGNVSVGWTSIITNTANDETHDWDTSLATPGIYYINISAYDSISQESYDLGNFTFELTAVVDNPPTVNAYEPGGTSGQTYNIGDMVTVKWNATDDNPMPADNINISYGNETVGWTSIITNTANDETEPWDTSTATPGIYYINISAYDSIGQETYDLGNYTFVLWKIDYIVIENSAGTAVGEMSFSVSDTYKYYAKGYNTTYGYSKDVNCVWGSNNTAVGTVTSPGTFTTFTVAGPGKCYVRAENVTLGLSDITKTITVTGAANNPPNQPTGLGVQGFVSGPGLIHITDDTPVLNWTFSDPDGNDQGGYNISVWNGSVSSGTLMWYKNSTGSGTTVTYGDLEDMSPLNLADGFYYNLSVKVSDTGGLWNTSDLLQFRMNTPPLSPTDGTNLGLYEIDHTPTVSWIAGGTDAEGDTITYYVYVGTSTSPTTLEWSGTATTCDLGSNVPLSDGTTYYWRVKANDSYEDSSSYAPSDTGDQFRMNTPPALSNGAVNPITGTTLTTFTYNVTYSDAEDAAPTSIVVYILKGDVNITGSPFTMNWQSGSNTTGANYTYPTTLSATGTDYTFYFNATDGTENATPTASIDAPDVSTSNNPPNPPTLTAPDNDTWTNNTPLFDWDFSDPNSDESRGYNVTISSSSAFSTVDYWVNKSTTENITKHLWGSGGESSSPIDDGTWYWRVKVKDVNGAWSDWNGWRIIKIDTVAPTVTISVSDTIISDADAGDTFWVNCSFSENMNDTVPPTISFSPDVVTSGTLTFVSGVWNANDDWYNVSYTIADVGEDQVGVDVSVSGGQDDAGNPQTPDPTTETDKFDVDTVNPSVSSTDPNNGGTVNTLWYNVTVIFNENMNTSVIPTVESDFASYNAPIWNTNTKLWINQSVEYTDLTTYWLNITGGRDQADNSMNYKNFSFTVDITAVDTILPDSSVDALTWYWNITGTAVITATATDASGVQCVGLWYSYSSENISWGVMTYVDLMTFVGGNTWEYTFTFFAVGWYNLSTNATDSSSNHNEEFVNYAGDVKCGYDPAPPFNPSSNTSDPAVNTWSNDTTVYVEWSGASDDLSGIAGYYYCWSISPATVPATSDNYTTTNTTTSPVLGDSNWYLHIITKDNASNLNLAAYHVGPFKIDSTPPSNPDSNISSSHTVGVWSSNNVVQVTWYGADGAISGIAGYYYCWSTSQTTIPTTDDNWTDSNSPSTTSPILSDNASWYLHIITEDNASNLNSTAYHIGPFRIDTTPPVTVLETSPSSPNGLNGWYNSSVTVYLNATDLAGVSKIYYRINGGWLNQWVEANGNTSFILTQDKADNYTIEYYAADILGQKETEKENKTIKIDKTGPTIIHTPLEDPQRNGAYNVTATITDSVSGVNKSAVYLHYNNGTDYIELMENNGNVFWWLIPNQSDNATISYYIQANDTAGNSKTTDEYTFRVDLSPITENDISFSHYFGMVGQNITIYVNVYNNGSSSVEWYVNITDEFGNVVANNTVIINKNSTITTSATYIIPSEADGETITFTVKIYDSGEKDSETAEFEVASSFTGGRPVKSFDPSLPMIFIAAVFAALLSLKSKHKRRKQK